MLNKKYFKVPQIKTTKKEQITITFLLNQIHNLKKFKLFEEEEILKVIKMSITNVFWKYS